MVRSFSNVKGCLLRPSLSCRNSAGPADVDLTSRHSSSSSGAAVIISVKDSTMSIVRFAASCTGLGVVAPFLSARSVTGVFLHGVGQPVPAGRSVVGNHPLIHDGQLRYRAAGNSGVAKRDSSRGYVTGDHRSGPDKCACANADVRQDGYVNPNLRPGADPWAGHQPGRALITGVEVVGDRHSGCEKNVVFKFGILGNVAITVNFYAVSDTAAIIDDAVGPDRDVIADFAAFSDDDAMPGLQAPPY